MKTTIPENLRAALHAAGVYPFQVRSSYPENDAPQNLQGRTHYVDPDTLRGFQARILDAGLFARGFKEYECSDSLIYWIVESVNSRPGHGGKNKRFVAFDIFGTVLTKGDHDDLTAWHRTTEAARKDGLAFLAKFNAEKHTRDELKARANRRIAEAKATLAALRTPRKKATPAA